MNFRSGLRTVKKNSCEAKWLNIMYEIIGAKSKFANQSTTHTIAMYSSDFLVNTLTSLITKADIL